MLAELLLNRDILDESFHILNHCLKFEYTRPELWSLLGDLYTKRADSNPDEAELNLEKAAFSYSKSSKYASLLSTECRSLLSMIPIHFIP